MSVLSAVRERLKGNYLVDEWGLDPMFHDMVFRFGGVRWNVIVEGAENIPETGAALMVVQRRFGLSEQPVVAVAVRQETHRRARMAIIPPWPLVEPTMRRSGAALPEPTEVRGLLRDNHIVTVGLAWSPLQRDVGALSIDMVAPAVELGVPIIPVATQGNELGRTWHVSFGEPITSSARFSFDRRVVDVVDATRSAIKEMQ